MKVFAMNDCDWMAADTLDEAKALYLKEYGEEVDEDARPLTDAEMDSLVFVETDSLPERRCTFREELERRVASGQEFPQFFASTEY